MNRRRAWVGIGVVVAVVVLALGWWAGRDLGPGFDVNPDVAPGGGPDDEHQVGVRIGIAPGSTPEYPMALLAAFDAAWGFPTPVPLPTEHP